MTRQSKRFLVMVFCVAFVLQPFAALASVIDRAFHEEVIGITIEYGNQSPVEQELVFQLDNDVQGFNHEFSDGTQYYGTNVDDNSSSTVAVLLSLPTVQELFESSYESYTPINHFKSVPIPMDTRPPITA